MFSKVHWISFCLSEETKHSLIFFFFGLRDFLVGTFILTDPWPKWFTSSCQLISLPATTTWPWVSWILLTMGMNFLFSLFLFPFLISHCFPRNSCRMNAKVPSGLQLLLCAWCAGLQLRNWDILEVCGGKLNPPPQVRVTSPLRGCPSLGKGIIVHSLFCWLQMHILWAVSQSVGKEQMS